MARPLAPVPDQPATAMPIFRNEEELARLTRLDLAWSRDQERKIYVQHRLWEQAAEVWRWLAEGAHLYVCGDALRMAKDVDAILHRIVRDHGGRDADGAKAYVEELKEAGRYQRDVYAVV